METGADPRSGNDPESKTGAFGRCVTPQEGKLVRRACRATASLGKNVRELEKFPQSALSNDQKIGFLRQLANDDLEQFLSHLSATGGQTYETLRVYAESQIAQKRTAQSYHQGKTSDRKTEKTRGNAMDLGNLDNSSKTDEQETRQDEFDPWQRCAVQGSEVLDAPGVYAVGQKGKGKGGWPINGNCDHCGQGMRGGTAHAWMKLAKPRWLNVRASFSRAVKRGTVG